MSGPIQGSPPKFLERLSAAGGSTIWNADQVPHEVREYLKEVAAAYGDNFFAVVFTNRGVNVPQVVAQIAAGAFAPGIAGYASIFVGFGCLTVVYST